MATNDAPPLVETSHCWVGAGSPEAVAVNDADAPALTVTLAGCLVIFGAVAAQATDAQATTSESVSAPATSAARRHLLATLKTVAPWFSTGAPSGDGTGSRDRRQEADSDGPAVKPASQRQAAGCRAGAPRRPRRRASASA